MRYNSSNNTITNPFGKCLDAGNPSQQLVFYPCNNGNNQKWKQENSTGRIWSYERQSGTNAVRCIEHTGLTNNNIVKVVPCNNNSSQKWFYDLGITQGNFPSSGITQFNNFSGGIKSTNYNTWVLDVKNGGIVAPDNTFNQTPVQLINSTNLNVAEKWGYNSSTQEIKGMNDYCLDAGNPNVEGQDLRINQCTGSTNQKWLKRNNGSIKSVANNYCIDIPGGNLVQTNLKLYACHGGWNQNWDTSGIGLNQANQQVSFRRAGTNKCIDAYGAYDGKPLYFWDCNGNTSQKFEVIQSVGAAFYKSVGSNFCLDIYNPVQNNNIYSWTCNYGDSQKWIFNSGNKLLSRDGSMNNGQCAAKYNPQNGDLLIAYYCGSQSGNDPNLKWDMI